MTDSISLADIDFIQESMQKIYRAIGRPRRILEEPLKRSVLLSLFDRKRRIGFIRIVSDYVTHAWLCDSYIDQKYQGWGLGKWLFECFLEHPAIDVKIRMLAANDAHQLYERYNFQRFEGMRQVRDKY